MIGIIAEIISDLNNARITIERIQYYRKKYHTLLRIVEIPIELHDMAHHKLLELLINNNIHPSQDQYHRFVKMLFVHKTHDVFIGSTYYKEIEKTVKKDVIDNIYKNII